MARLLAAVGLAVAFAGAAHTESATRAPDVDVIVPVPPFEHDRLHYYDGRPHHLVPGTVSINGSPYECDLDRRRFKTEDDFVAHIRAAHHARPNEIPDALVVREGIVHFIGSNPSR